MIDFGESVTGFDSVDIQVSGGSVSGLVDDGGGVFTATIDAAADGEVQVAIAAGVAQDVASNSNLAAITFTLDVDTDRPTPVITGPATPTNTDPFALVIDFGEPVTGFESTDIQVSGGSVSGLVDDGGGVFTATIDADADGVVQVNIAANVAQDLASNSNAAVIPLTLTVDTSVPTPVLTSPVSPTNADPFTVVIDFGEPVTGFEPADIQVSGGSVSGLTDDGGGTFTARIDANADGEMQVDIAAGVAQDLANNSNAAAISFEITVDTSIAPRILVASGSNQPDSAETLLLDEGQSTHFTVQLGSPPDPNDGPVVISFSREDTLGSSVLIQDRGNLLLFAEYKDGQAGVDGLFGIHDLDFDDTNGVLYGISRFDDAISVFSRENSSDGFSLVQSIQDDGVFPFSRVSGATLIDGLDFADVVAVDPSGTTVVASGNFDDDVLVFRRNSTSGPLVLAHTLQNDASSSPVDGAQPIAGFDGPKSLAFTPDGTQLLVGSQFDHTLRVFDVTTGAVSPLQIFQNNFGDPVGGAVPVTGLSGLVSIATSHELSNPFVYAVSSFGDTLSVFRRDDSTGEYSLLQTFRDEGGFLRQGEVPIAGLAEPTSVAVTPDNKHVFVATKGSDTLLVFQRDPTTHELSLVQVMQNAASPSPIPGATQVQGLTDPTSVVSDDRYLYAASPKSDALFVFRREAATFGVFQVFQDDEATPRLDGATELTQLQGAQTVEISLDGQSVFVGADGDSAITELRWEGLVFTAEDFDSPRSVFVKAAADSDGDNDQTTFTLSADDWESATVTVTQLDSERGILVATSEEGPFSDAIAPLEVPEGGSSTFFVKLKASLQNPVTVLVWPISGDPDIRGNATSLTFDPETATVPQAVTLTAAPDNRDLVDGITTFRIWVDREVWTEARVIAREIDDDRDESIFAADDQYTAIEGTLKEVNAAESVLVNDLGQGELSISTFDVTTSLGASVNVGTAGGFQYDPRGAERLEALAAGQQIVDTFTYTMRDDLAERTGTVSVTVSGVNDTPTAQSDHLTSDEDSVLTLSTQLLDNDTDRDESDQLTIVEVDAISSLGAVLSVNANGIVTYDPRNVDAIQRLQNGQSVVDTFEYTVADGNGGQSTAIVTIAVAGINHWQNLSNPIDVDGDGNVSPLDVLIIINELNSRGTHTLPDLAQPSRQKLDVNGDSFVAPVDALQVINFLNNPFGEGEAAFPKDNVIVHLHEYSQPLITMRDALSPDPFAATRVARTAAIPGTLGYMHSTRELFTIGVLPSLADSIDDLSTELDDNRFWKQAAIDEAILKLFGEE